MTLLIAATIAALGLAAAYALACYVRPYARCVWCHGYGHVDRRIGRGHRPCRVCRATGRRLRIGRRIANRVIVRRRAYLATTKIGRRAS